MPYEANPPPMYICGDIPRMSADAKSRVETILKAGCVHCSCVQASLVKRLTRGGVVTVCLQCDGCGRALGSAMKRSDHYYWQSYPEWDQKLVDDCEAKQRERLAEFAIQNESDSENWKEWYNNNFLRSEKWQTIRAKVLTRDQFVCQACLSARATEVHHEGYSRGAAPPMWMLYSICRPCHQRVTDGWTD